MKHLYIIYEYEAKFALENTKNWKDFDWRDMHSVAYGFGKSIIKMLVLSLDLCPTSKLALSTLLSVRILDALMFSV